MLLDLRPSVARKKKNATRSHGFRSSTSGGLTAPVATNQSPSGAYAPLGSVSRNTRPASQRCRRAARKRATRCVEQRGLAPVAGNPRPSRASRVYNTVVPANFAAVEIQNCIRPQFSFFLPILHAQFTLCLCAFVAQESDRRYIALRSSAAGAGPRSSQPFSVGVRLSQLANNRPQSLFSASSTRLRPIAGIQ